MSVCSVTLCSHWLAYCENVEWLEASGTGRQVSQVRQVSLRQRGQVSGRQKVAHALLQVRSVFRVLSRYSFGRETSPNLGNSPPEIFGQVYCHYLLFH